MINYSEGETMSSNLRISLFSLRLSIFIVMFFWTLDKFIRPDHAAGVYASFYLIEGVGPAVMRVIAGLELALVFGFLLGLKKRFTYGAILILHGISTLSSYKQYLQPFEKVNLLFFAAWPTLAACLALYLLRDEDKLLTLSPKG